jgi:hypothetical protein
VKTKSCSSIGNPEVSIPVCVCTCSVSNVESQSQKNDYKAVGDKQKPKVTLTDSQLTVSRKGMLCINIIKVCKWPVSIAAQSKASTVFGRSNIGIAGSNPAQDMDMCLCFFVLCCPV